MTFTRTQLWEMANKAEADAKDSKTPRTDTCVNMQKALGVDIEDVGHRDITGLCRQLEEELAALRIKNSNLLNMAAGILSPFVEDGIPMQRGEARDVLKVLRAAR